MQEIIEIMGQGKKTMREMNRLIRVLKRNRSLKKTSLNSYARPMYAPNGQLVEQPVDESAAPVQEAVVNQVEETVSAE